MGVDCQDIARVMHWGAPSTLEEYIQKSGHSRRNGKPAKGILYLKGRNKYITSGIKYYYRECFHM